MSTNAQDTAAECVRLGFGEPLGVSAEHGDGMADLASMLSPCYAAHEQRLAALETDGLVDAE